MGRIYARTRLKIKYIKGKSNVVADALSRKHGEVHRNSTDLIRKLLTITKLRISGEVLSNLQKEYFSDEYFKKMGKHRRTLLKKE